MNLDIKQYELNRCIVFKKVNEPFGGLSNMSYSPIVINGVVIKTAEGLYQSLRYPDYPDVQTEIIGQKSPMGAKMASKKYKKLNLTRENFGDDNESTLEKNDRIKIMEWCLQVKLSCNLDSFGRLLRETRNLDIVEFGPTKSHCFWGTFPNRIHPEILEGKNVLGQLLTKLRDEYLEKLQNKRTIDLMVVEPPEIENFKLFGNDIKRIDYRTKYLKK